jgi:hypothetical protein
MFKPTTWVAVAGVVVFGLIVADFLKNPAGTKAVSNGAVALATPTIQGLSGQKVA